MVIRRDKRNPMGIKYYIKKENDYWKIVGPNSLGTEISCKNYTIVKKWLKLFKEYDVIEWDLCRDMISDLNLDEVRYFSFNNIKFIAKNSQNVEMEFCCDSVGAPKEVRILRTNR